MRELCSVIISCSQAECDVIHEQARIERRTISAYVLRIVLASVHVDLKILPAFQPSSLKIVFWKRPIQVGGPRTTFVIRCDKNEAAQIRAAARRRDVPVSAYVAIALRRAWKIQIKVAGMVAPEFPL